MAQTINGGVDGTAFTTRLNAILADLYGNNSVVTPVIGQIRFSSGKLSVCTQVDPNITFTDLPFTIAGATATLDSNAISTIEFSSVSGFTSTDLTGANNDTSLATSEAIVDKITADIAAYNTVHNVTSGVHGVTGNIVGTGGAQTLTDKTLTSPTITGGTISGTPISGSTGSFSSLDVIGDGTANHGGTITGGASSITINPDPTSTTGTVVIAGDLTVNGTTTTINSTTQSHADKDIILAAGATTNAGVTGAGLLLGSPATLESWLYNGTNWAASAPLRAEAYDVGPTNIINTSGNWVDRANSIPVGSLSGFVATGNLPTATTSVLGIASFNTNDFAVSSGAVSIKTDGVAPATQIAGGTLASDVKVNTDNFDTTGSRQLDVNKGGTGKVTVTAGVLLRGDNANDLVETTIGTGLDINTNSLDVDLSELDIQSFGQVPSFASNGGRVVVVNTAGNALEYSTSVVDNSAIESWARTSGGAGTTAMTNRVLTHSGTNAATGYAWVDANDSDALNVGLGATEAINVASVSTTGNISAAGNLSVSGNTTLGNAATNTIAINGLVSSGITPDGLNTRDFGSNTARWKSVHTNNLSLGGQSVTEIDTDISGTAPTVNTSVPSVQAVRTYIDNIEAGGSIVILAQPGTKNVPAGGIAIVTISGLTKMFTAVTSQTGVNKGTDFDGSGSGTNFEATANWTEFTAVGGTQVTINKFTGDGTEINFTLSLDPGSEDNVNVFIDGVYQLKDAYTVSGTTLSFGTGNPVPNGSKVEVLIGTTVNFASGSIGDVTATGTIIAPNIGNASTSYLGDGSNLSNLPAGYSGWTVSDGTNMSLTASGETLTLTAGGGTAIAVSDNALSISSPSLGTGANQAARGDHTHVASLSVTAGVCTGGTGGTNRSACEDGGGLWAPATLNIGAGGTTASVSIETLLANITIDDLG